MSSASNQLQNSEGGPEVVLTNKNNFTLTAEEQLYTISHKISVNYI